MGRSGSLFLGWLSLWASTRGLEAYGCESGRADGVGTGFASYLPGKVCPPATMSVQHHESHSKARRWRPLRRLALRGAACVGFGLGGIAHGQSPSPGGTGPAATRLAETAPAPLVVRAPIVEGRSAPIRPGGPRSPSNTAPRAAVGLDLCRALFDKLDRNRDGQIHLAEADQGGIHRLDFRRGDRDANGRLDRSEFTLALSRLLSSRDLPLASDFAAETTRLIALEKLRAPTTSTATLQEQEAERMRSLRERTAPIGPAAGRLRPAVRLLDGDRGGESSSGSGGS